MSDRDTKKQMKKHAKAAQIATIRASMGLSDDVSASAVLARRCNDICARLFETLLTPAEKAFAQAACIPYSEILKARELREKGTTEKVDTILESAEKLLAASK